MFLTTKVNYPSIYAAVTTEAMQLPRTKNCHIRENAFKKGATNMTARSFCLWVNDELLPSSDLEPGAPRRIGVEVSRNWLHSMGFKVKRINYQANTMMVMN